MISSTHRPRPRPLVGALLVLTAATAASPGLAQTTTAPVIISATRTGEPVASVLRDVTLLSAEDIAASGVADLAQLLARVAGVQVARNGPFATPSLFIRGHNANQTLVLVDGQRIASAFSGLAALQNIGLEQIAAVEIVRGPHATLYGADAVGGVVNIITRQADAAHGPAAEASVGTGAHRSVLLQGRARVDSQATRLDASASHERSDGWNAIADPRAFGYNPDRDGWRVSRGQIAIAHRFDAAWSAHARLTGSRSNSQYDGSASRDDRALVDLGALQAGLRWQGHGVASEVTLAQGREAAEFISTFGGRYVTRNAQAQWQTNAALGPGLGGLALLEWRQERIADTDGLLLRRRSTTSGALGLDWKGPLQVAGHVRLDDSSQYGRRTTGALSAGMPLGPGLRLAVNAGTAFKAPTFNDLYYPGFSNPALRPETSRSVDAQLVWQQADTRLALTAHHAEVRDLIQFVCDASFNCAPQNVARARLQGATLAFAQRLGALRVEASVDTLDARNRLTDRRLPRRAREWGQLTLASPLGAGVDLAATFRAVGQRFDDAANRNRLPGYSVLDMSARWRIGRDWQLAAAVDNLFDRDYETARGYATGGRLWRLTVSGTF